MSDIGTSTLYSTEWIVDQLRALNPRSIVDVGCGWGRWGFLAREFLELWAHRFTPDEWAVHIDAIDAHPGTWTPIHPYVYDRCLEVDVRDWVPDRNYDVAIACDVIEHLPKDDGLVVLERLKDHCGAVLLGLPLGWGTRQGFDGNPYEAHRSSWEESEVRDIRSWVMTHTEDGLQYGLFLVGR